MTQIDHPRTSVIVLTRNGMPLLKRCLDAVLRQKAPWTFEVIAVDSSSSDGTWEFLQSLPVRSIRINPAEFNHGGTRNMAARYARGSFLVFLVQDAIPANESWLANLVTVVEQSGVAGAYSRQVARKESWLITKYMTTGTTPNDEKSEWKVLPSGSNFADLPPHHQFRLATFQNNSSCIRRSVWLEQPFTVLPYGEDIDWGKRAIEAGYVLVYQPASVVYHSHDRSPYYVLKRAYADHYLCAQLFNFIMIPSFTRMIRISVWQLVTAWRYTSHQRAPFPQKLRCAIVAPIYMAAFALGQYIGARMFRWLSGRPWLYPLDRVLRVGV